MDYHVTYQSHLPGEGNIRFLNYLEYCTVTSVKEIIKNKDVENLEGTSGKIVLSDPKKVNIRFSEKNKFC